MSDVAVLAPDPTTGQMLPATVAEADLQAAIAAGAVKPPTTAPYEKEMGGGLGQAASFALGAGRTASGGLMDGLLAASAGIVGGEQAHNEMIHGLNVAKDVNPYATMGGEASGLFVGAGEGVMAQGAAVEEAVASKLGTGLLGKVGSMGARGAVEGAILGQQRQISEDTLGDPDAVGEKLFAASTKDALIGGALGAGLGALGHFGSEALGAMRFKSGPRPSGLLDDVAGVDGAGAALRKEAATAEDLVTDLQKAGATSEQAARMADDVSSVARARTAGGSMGGLVDDAAARYAAARAGGNADMQEVLAKGYTDRATHLAQQEGTLDLAARKLADKGTRVMRDMEDTLNEAQFTEKSPQMAKLTDPAKWEVARDASMKALQDADSVVSQLEQTASKGGQEGAVRNLRKQLTDFYGANAKIGEAATEGARENATRDFFMKMDALKRSADRFAGHGTSAFGRTEAAIEFRGLADRLRTSLEDESVWGAAGGAQRELNSTFSLAKGRRDDFGRRFAVSVDQASGVPVPELDAGKLKSALRQINGAEGDQAVKTTEAMIDGLRARTAAAEKHLSFTPEQAAKIAAGKTALNDFADTFATSRKEAAIVERLRTQQLEEQGHGIGGIIGLATSIMTKPLQTMERLGALKAATDRFEKSIANGIERFVGGKASAGRAAAEEAAATMRPRAKVADEIGQLRQLTSNPPAMQERVRQLLGSVSDFAPRIHGSAATVAMRALTYLASEAPQGRADMSMIASKTAVRFSDQELSVYENKRTAAFHPETVVTEMRSGKLNRDGIRTVKAVYPQLFAQMQDTARTQLIELDRKGLLGKMPYQQKAAIATLLETAPDGTWQPDFMALMQSTKAPPPAGPTEADPIPKGGGRRPIKMNVASFQTEAQQIEGRTTHK